MKARESVRASSGQGAGVAARHEAAHAVVAVRLGLPLSSTDIRERRVELPSGDVMLSHGFTSIYMGEVIGKRVQYARPRAVFAAAGIASEAARGTQPGDASMEDDLDGVRRHATTLGIDDGALPQFLADVVKEAGALLAVDGGVAWDRVTVRLRARRALTGDEVRRIVEASEAERTENR